MNLSEVVIRILVNDFQLCFDFYTEKLGYEVFWGDRSGPFASFCAPDAERPSFSMFLAKNQDMYEGYRPLDGVGKTDQVIYIISTDDVDRDYILLKERGVVFMGEPQTINDWYMRCVYFRDPEGNLFELSQDGADPI